jgi:hypothetical protein
MKQKESFYNGQKTDSTTSWACAKRPSCDALSDFCDLNTKFSGPKHILESCASEMHWGLPEPATNLRNAVEPWKIPEKITEVYTVRK